jgi:hypothetical protein
MVGFCIGLVAGIFLTFGVIAWKVGLWEFIIPPPDRWWD